MGFLNFFGLEGSLSCVEYNKVFHLCHF